MSVMQGLLEVVARLDVLSEEERRRAPREEWKRVEEAGWEVVRRAEGVEVKKEKKEKEEEKKEEEEEMEEEEEEIRIGWEEEEVRIGWEEEVRDGWWKCRGSCGRELEMNAENFHRDGSKKSGFVSKCKTCFKEKVVVPKGFRLCMGGCCKMLEKNGDNFPLTKKGFSRYCKSCHDAHFGKKEDDVPDGHQRCKGDCEKVLKLSEENFVRDKKACSGFRSKCRSCRSDEQSAKRVTARGDKPKKRVRPKEDLPDGHQRCMGECGRVLKMSKENFVREKRTRSGFQSICKMCKNAGKKARAAAKKRARVEPEQVDELPEERVEDVPLVRVDEFSDPTTTMK